MLVFPGNDVGIETSQVGDLADMARSTIDLAISPESLSDGMASLFDSSSMEDNTIWFISHYWHCTKNEVFN